MKKNWLIRTANNYILGPISKNKLVELIESKALKPDDEVSSGNGYWFYIREKEFVEKYIYNDNTQNFLCIDLDDEINVEKSNQEELNSQSDEISNDSNEQKLPDDDLLEYPEIE